MTTVSIIIPTFNRGAVIPLTLDSIYSQSYQDWECLIVDDMSTDNTKHVVQDYCSKDNRFKYLVNTHKKGAQGARNTGLYASNAEWVFFFDSDNMMHSNLLETLISEVRPDIDVCKCFSNVIDTTTKQRVYKQEWVATGNIQKELFNGKTYVDFNQQIIRRSKMIEIGGLDEDCPSLQEFDTNIRLSRICTYHTVQKALVDYCIGGYDTISANYSKQVRGKFYNLSKFKKEWLENKNNADRFIYELFDKLKHIDSLSFRIKYFIKVFCRVPEMIPFYCAKKTNKFFRHIQSATSNNE